VEGSYERGTKPSGSITGDEFDQPSNYQLIHVVGSLTSGEC
jgi:hypothetical protein